MTEEEEARTLSSLKEILPTAAVVCVKEESDTDTASENECDNNYLPPAAYRLGRVKGM
jgi:hypothetical protein